MSASWYDVLGISRDADASEIRAAWKASISDLDPTDRRFGLYNEAAGVLLDAGKRDEYDATLPATPEPDEAVDEDSDNSEDDESPTEDQPAEGDSADGESAEDDTAATVQEAGDSAGPGFDVPLKFLAALAIVLVIVLAAAATLQFTVDDPADVEASMAQARVAAEKSVPKVLAYDYKSPETSHDQAMRVLTGDLKSEYDALWNDALAPNLGKAKATLTTSLVASGLVDASSGGDRVKVLTVLKMHTVNAGGNQDSLTTLTATMVNHNGTWLIEELDGWDSSESEKPSDSSEPADPSAKPSADPSTSGSSAPSPKPSGATPSPSGSATPK